ncbi:MAG: amino acid ABC transporter ATP-binding protein [Treponemataceae bacterium]|nr:amino acid ABC transporter ATP-binding protein [Treponemataceae bacterium]
MLKVRNLHKTFNDTQVLKGIDLDVDKGDVIAVIGPSGSGKTTLLRCLNFLEKAEEGSLEFDNKSYNLSEISKKDILAIRQKTGFVFQNFNLFRNKNVLKNVTEGLTTVRKIKKEEAYGIALAVLKKVGMENRLDSYPYQISGGQQQRVAIARALATNPQIIYFDEPTSALDPELIGEVLAVIKKLADEGMTMIVVTHELNFAKNVSNKVIFMEDGKIVESNSTKEFFENPKMERTREFLNTFTNK